MNRGEFRHPIVIQERTRSQDSTTGELSYTWATWASPWAKFEPLSVKDFIAAQAAQSQIVARATILYRADVDPANMRILYRGKYYKIQGVLADKDSGIEYLTMPLSEDI